MRLLRLTVLDWRLQWHERRAEHHERTAAAAWARIRAIGEAHYARQPGDRR